MMRITHNSDNKTGISQRCLARRYKINQEAICRNMKRANKYSNKEAYKSSEIC